VYYVYFSEGDCPVSRLSADVVMEATLNTALVHAKMQQLEKDVTFLWCKAQCKWRQNTNPEDEVALAVLTTPADPAAIAKEMHVILTRRANRKSFPFLRRLARRGRLYAFQKSGTSWGALHDQTRTDVLLRGAVHALVR
jgi:hypothetical protein